MYEWLKDYRLLEEKITYLEYNLTKTKRELRRWENVNDLGKYKLEAESLGANVEEKIEAIEYELAHQMNDLFDLKKLICTFNGLEYKILYRKHVEGKTLETIACELNYSTNYIKMKHANIMRMMKYAEKVSSK
ncbi:hypothetical protein CNQ87_10620 [Lysinibacillus fusiformis]|uniref:hypothetical protein n=1 Tax=Lysinibacillus fusiformis TaxID=28031 RepID=UPI000BBA5958|nr:hypothetical protein [Lysinibacillus fusiformis]PCD84786.1 hypothetical protein CNQ87_10620 [Lysinibacillus fusiformis]